MQPSHVIQSQRHSASHPIYHDYEPYYKDKTTVSIQTEKIDSSDALFEKSKKKESDKDTKKRDLASKKNNQRTLTESSPDEKDKIATIDDKMDGTNEDEDQDPSMYITSY